MVPPIAQTSLFTFASYDEMVAAYRGEITRPIYSRGLNPTVRMFEEMLAELEGAEDALGFASGMAAISAAVLSFVAPGDRIVAVRNVYPDAFRLFGTFLPRMGVTVDYVDGRDLAAVEAALPGARLLYLESPTSWQIEALDVARAGGARARGRHPLGDRQQLGDADLPEPAGARRRPRGALGVEVHRRPQRRGRRRRRRLARALIDRLRAELYPYVGGRLAPFDAWLLIRGLRTLPVRMLAHQASALEIARRLADRPEVTRVNHPGLGALPPGLRGTSGLFSFEVDRRASTCAPSATPSASSSSASAGAGTRASSSPARSCCEQKAQPNSAHTFGISPRSVRLHIGLEGTEALWDDIAAGFDAARKLTSINHRE